MNALFFILYDALHVIMQPLERMEGQHHEFDSAYTDKILLINKTSDQHWLLTS